MVFKGLEMETGDFVAFQTKVVPLPEVQAVVIDVENGVLEVMSTILTVFKCGGKFRDDQVDRIMVVYKADVAIPQESRGKNFPKHQRVSVVVKGKEYFGIIIAAFDGVVVMRGDDGQLITGGASFYNAVA